MPSRGGGASTWKGRELAGERASGMVWRGVACRVRVRGWHETRDGGVLGFRGQTQAWGNKG